MKNILFQADQHSATMLEFFRQGSKSSPESLSSERRLDEDCELENQPSFIVYGPIICRLNTKWHEHEHSGTDCVVRPSALSLVLTKAFWVPENDGRDLLGDGINDFPFRYIKNGLV